MGLSFEERVGSYRLVLYSTKLLKATPSMDDLRKEEKGKYHIDNGTLSLAEPTYSVYTYYSPIPSYLASK